MRYALFILGMCWLLACSGPAEYDNSLIFRYNESAGITSLDPAFSRNQANIWAVNQLFNGLVQMDNDLRVQACIARSWSVSDSGTTYTFNLRKDVRFHDDACFSDQGQREVRAGDFLYSFERLRSAELAAPGSWVFQKVKAFSAPDDTTFVIHLSEPFPPFLSLLSMKYCSVIPEEAVAYYGTNFREHPVGTGPFYFKIWVENEKLVMRRNEDYFETDSTGKRLPYLESVAVTFIPDNQSAFLEFIKGRLDLVSGIDASYKDELLTFSGELQPKYQDRFKVYRQPYLNSEYLAFLVDSSEGSSAQKILLNPKVRQAINYGFDRRKMMRYLRNNIGTPAEAGMIPKGLMAYDTSRIPGYSFQPEKAARLLE